MTGAELVVASMKILRAPIPAELVLQPVLLTGSQAELPAAMEAEPRQAGRLREVLTMRAETRQAWTRRAWTRQVAQPLEQTWETRVELPLVPILISVALAELPQAPIPTLVTLVLHLLLLPVTPVLLLIQPLATLVLLLIQPLATLVLLPLLRLVTLVLLLLPLLLQREQA
ncbi:hypothetical protein GGI13_008472, partial [Coemansia sp. RSA 455]